jgi:hypothetical protein
MMRQAVLALGYKQNQIKILLDEEATLANIRNSIDSWLIKGVDEDDHVFFYFSGHGSQIFDKNGDEADKADEVLITHDAQLGVNTLKNVFVDDMFNEMLGKVPSKYVFILIDACHSGTATRGINQNGFVFPKYFEYPGMPRTMRSVGFTSKSIQGVDAGSYSALSAAQDNQRAQASNVGSYFTRGVYNAILTSKEHNWPLTMLTLHDKTTSFIAEEMPDPKLVHKPALVGGVDNNQKNLFITAKASPRPSDKPEPWIHEIQRIADNAVYDVVIKTNNATFNVGDPLVISCNINRTGYVNVITMQPGDEVPTILFPNQFHPENQVEEGDSITIPSPGDSFALAAAPPTGEAIIAVFLTPFKLNLYKEGYGDGTFKTMSRASTRGFVITSVPSTPEPNPALTSALPTPEPIKPNARDYGAGIVYVKIK